MALIDLSEKTGGSMRGSNQRDFMIDEIVFYPPPGEADYDNSYRITVKQSGAGQTADVGGLGGCEINVSGDVSLRYAGWLRLVEERLELSAATGRMLLFYDPVRDKSYECLCRKHRVKQSVSKVGFYDYEFVLVSQVNGLTWTGGTSIVVRGTNDSIPAFDQQSIGDVIADSQRLASDYKKMGSTGNAPVSDDVKGRVDVTDSTSLRGGRGQSNQKTPSPFPTIPERPTTGTRSSGRGTQSQSGNSNRSATDPNRNWSGKRVKPTKKGRYNPNDPNRNWAGKVSE